MILNININISININKEEYLKNVGISLGSSFLIYEYLILTDIIGIKYSILIDYSID